MKAGGIEWYYHPIKEYFAAKFEGMDLFIFPVPVIPIKWVVEVRGMRKVALKKQFSLFEEAAKAAIGEAKMQLGVPKRPLATGI
jgi:hypothetical protein